MRAVDTGVIVAAFASWHEAHDVAVAELAQRPRAAAHSMVETVSVLTRLPAPHRAPLELVASFLEAAFDQEPLTLDGAQTSRLLVERLPALAVSGGAVYDALIAETVRAADGVLVTLDRRALTTYDRVGVRSVLLDDGSL
ncbi:PIN domain-containing protein [Microbacterium sp. 18062]|uniref:PIN domain-containing protein n=1 Tax=Microbacterium sp. 18062 TaxID=2681410 RepID=UPI00135B2BFA|nr:PIN domain-containing protein [Microbacterium sp. 18062]